MSGGAQIDLPVTFEEPDVDYTTTSFEGAQSFPAIDPTDPDNNVVRVLKDNMAGSSAGTTIGTPAGFATNIPLTLTDSKMTVRVWSPDAGIPVRLKVEDSNDPTHTCETETNTTLAGEWETLEFDFVNQAPGTELLSVGLAMGWTYNMASIFFNFGTDGPTAGEKTYYFDDVWFGDMMVNTTDLAGQNLRVFPNPATEQWTIATQDIRINVVDVFDVQGKLVLRLHPANNWVKIDASNLGSGIYIANISTDSGTKMVRLVKS